MKEFWKTTAHGLKIYILFSPIIISIYYYSVTFTTFGPMPLGEAALAFIEFTLYMYIGCLGLLIMPSIYLLANIYQSPLLYSFLIITNLVLAVLVVYVIGSLPKWVNNFFPVLIGRWHKLIIFIAIVIIVGLLLIPAYYIFPYLTL